MGRPHGHLDAGVAQELLDRTWSDPAHHQVRGEGVPEIMENEVIKSRPPASLGKGIFHIKEPSALGVTKDKLIPPKSLSSGNCVQGRPGSI